MIKFYSLNCLIALITLLLSVSALRLNASTGSVVKAPAFLPSIPSLLPDDQSVTYTYVSDAGGTAGSLPESSWVNAKINVQEVTERTKLNGQFEYTWRGNFQDTTRHLRFSCSDVNIVNPNINANCSSPGICDPDYQEPDPAAPGSTPNYIGNWQMAPTVLSSDYVSPPQSVNITVGQTVVGEVTTASRRWSSVSQWDLLPSCKVLELFSGFGNYYKLRITLTRNGVTNPPLISILPVDGGVDFNRNSGSATLIDTSFNSNNQFAIKFAANDGYQTQIQWSPDPTSWPIANVFNITGNGNTKTFTDTSSTTAQARFYRLICSSQNSPSIAGFTRLSKGNGVANIFWGSQFQKGQNRVQEIFDQPTSGLQVGFWNPASSSYIFSQFNGTKWSNPNLQFPVGYGMLINTTTLVNAKLHGFIKTGNPVGNPLNALQVLRSSIIPKQGSISSLGYIPVDGDSILKWNVGTQSFVAYDYLGTSWVPSQPTIGLGEGFFVQPAVYRNWNQIINPCP